MNQFRKTAFAKTKRSKSYQQSLRMLSLKDDTKYIERLTSFSY